MMEDFRRPDHNDFATSSELHQRGFTGIRQNSITHEQELWVEGHIKLAISIERMQHDPDLWNKKYAELFDLHHVETKGN